MLLPITLPKRSPPRPRAVTIINHVSTIEPGRTISIHIAIPPPLGDPSDTLNTDIDVSDAIVTGYRSEHGRITGIHAMTVENESLCTVRMCQDSPRNDYL